MWWTQEKCERLLCFILARWQMRPDTLSQRLNWSPPVLQVIRSGLMVGLSLAVMVSFCSLCFHCDPVTKLLRSYRKTKGAFSCVTLLIPAIIQVFGNYSCGGAQQSHPAAQQSHGFHFEGNRRICLLRCTSATVSAVALPHDSISLRKANLHEELTDT